MQEIYEQADKLHLDLSADGYNFVVFTVQDAQRTAYTASAADVVEELLNYFLRYPDYILFRCSLLSYAVLIKGDAGQLSQLTERGVEIIRQRCENAETPLDWYAAVGVPTYRLSGLARCYADANHVLAYRHLYPSQHIFSADMLRTERETAAHMDAMQSGMVDPMVLRSFVQTGTPEETEAFVEEYIESLGGAENSMMFCLTAVLHAALELRETESQKRSNDITGEALRYIDRNFSDPNISLNSVAEASNISANYLSALFSQKVGLSFVEYLTKKRMARAQQLLRQTSKRSGEIAYEVGYKDPRYFSFVFKKTQGCTPSSYRTGEMEAE